MKYTDILLDLDDTLIDTVENTRLTLIEIYDDYGLGNYFPSFDDFYAVYKANVTQLWTLYSSGKISKKTLQYERFVAPLTPVESISTEQALAMNDDFIARIMLKKTLIDGAKEFLDYLYPKYKIHILSNGFTEMQFKKITSAGLDGYFDKVILSDKVGVNKPHPDIFSFALNETGKTNKEVIMIGDNLHTDISGARNSNIDQIWFNPQNQHSSEFTPTYTITRLAEIENIL
ncbi:YjjG family noncanonical pyrimidine nucleotidase [Dysgonomonas sp. PFB1-18]|uniref:YjjG family noncanonical pyrimidine nucleotidase n=1 Tax=unclassified Dysgonomonas TaxID=2630389 RepID=UPI00247523DD|nr:MULTISPECIES: YjjG family noncanonical pyrimidine nucleotidase [unclassified Dysgonomonas]MDL2303493.1 YjjG family noncanonical pyrimidine nucleotidase [Dysgonomonas sp. OttesenSCG-928-D17]MDH6309911.1 YjjG family noncanonical pyrimidine nucleotidase [Dysgonomonas sp. PF1-14]MDH6339455.1 YjjG family noncanonical pyrimidine nucleotidase [Dysgonomonas sp. PF1-16]MDH6380955.1 YjjG family noncanonical pyrimidine nucleotidase [Dysgonomonas sp. PFB1-18]MDH6397964.1 YjjG family noncanonical pyrimi